MKKMANKAYVVDLSSKAYIDFYEKLHMKKLYGS